MGTRNWDSSLLTRLKRDRNQAAFFTRQNVLTNTTSNALQHQTFPTFNPQTGNYNASKMIDIHDGNITYYWRAFPSTVTSVAPAAVIAGFPGNNVNGVVGLYNQPISDNSPK